MRRRRRPEPDRAGLLTSCRLAREAISALVDGEEAPIGEAVVAAHIARCRPCREYRARIESLKRQLRVRALATSSGGVDVVLDLLRCAGEASRPDGVPALSWTDRHRRACLRATQWAAGVVPLGFALPALALGAFAHIHVVPSHVISRCTVGLGHLRRR